MPDKHPDLLQLIRKCLDEDRFVDTRHTLERQSERNITRLEVIYVLRNGYHEKRKDRWEEFYKAWNYSIRGKTFERREVRVIVSFDEAGLLIISAIDLSI